MPLSRAATMFSWFRRGALGIGEQGVFAASHLIANVLLARGLDAEGYGVFATLFAVFILLNYLHTALVADPLLVLARQSGRPAAYVAAAIRGQFVVSAALIVIGLLVALLLQSLQATALAIVLLGFGPSAACLLLLWTVRKAFYCLLAPKASFLGGLAYLGLLSGSLIALQYAGHLSAATAYLATAGAALVVAVGLARALPATDTEQRPSLGKLARSHWRYGRWLLAATPFRWAPMHIHYLLLPVLLVGGTALSGVLRATMVLVAPMLHAQMAAAALIIPVFSERAHQGQPLPRLRLLAILVTASGLFFGVLALSGDRLMDLVYGGSVAHPAGLVALLAAVPVITAAILVTQAEVLARKRLGAMLLSYVVGASVAVGAGWWLAVTKGLRGVAIAMIAAYVVILLIQAVAVYRPAPRDRTGASVPR